MHVRVYWGMEEKEKDLHEGHVKGRGYKEGAYW